MNSWNTFGLRLSAAALGALVALPALAAEDTLPDMMEKPDGFPARTLTMAG